jgi:hypothetical protein
MRPLKPFHGDDGWGYAPYGYGELLGSMEYEVLGEVNHGDYQGDSQVLLKDGDRYGYLTYGWGSCSGCDALQSCQTVEEATELRDQLASAVLWFDSAVEMSDYLKNRDWKLQWLGEDRGREVIALAEKVLLLGGPALDI